MDAEFLARAGARPSAQTCRSVRPREPGRVRNGTAWEIGSIVADVEHLPYADQSVDLVAVHDGLHHLDDPYAGLSEMARVARRWVVVTEPARASATRLAIGVGLALETEEAGNRVARNGPARSGHSGGPWVRVPVGLSAMPGATAPPGLGVQASEPTGHFSLSVRVGWRLANALLGRWGNKMVVVAERAQSAATDSQSPSTPSPIRSTT